MTAHITAIFVAPTKHGEQIAVDVVQLKASKGIVGDRFYGFSRKNPGRNITLIESEAIEEFNSIYRLSVRVNATRRNLVTRGIKLNDLVGKTFKIGDVLCQGFELCEPCKVMARHFPATTLSQAEIIRAFTGRGGIRAAVLTDGIVKLNDEICTDLGTISEDRYLTT